MSEFIKALEGRRSIYSLSKNIKLSEMELEEVIKSAVRATPTAFNIQSQRVVILFNDNHLKLWEIVEDELRAIVPEETFPNTQNKLNGFAAGKGTILFFEDEEVINGVKEQFPLYADNFDGWSEQASGMTQGNVWVALSEHGIGANLQHYNPIIDNEVKQHWGLPESYKLRAQIVFGNIKSPAGEKEVIDDEIRFKTFN